MGFRAECLGFQSWVTPDASGVWGFGWGVYGLGFGVSEWIKTQFWFPPDDKEKSLKGFGMKL